MTLTKSAIVTLAAILGGVGIASAASPQPRDPQKYTRLLIPFHESVVAVGGVWNVHWWIHNDSDTPTDAFPLAVGGGLPPPPGPEGPRVFILGNPAIVPHGTPHGMNGDALPAYPAAPVVPVITTGTGAFLYAESGHLAQLAIGGSLQFNNGPAAALHAIPETSFASGTRSILPIPVLTGSRYALRIYALPETAGSPEVTVRIYDMQALSLGGDEPLIAMIQTSLVTPASRVGPCFEPCDVPGGPFAPASLQLFDLARRDPSALFSTLRVEIEPQSPNLRWWAVVSATDNVSQAVTLYELQR
ncbi:MAG: hypothetical protein QOC81_3510 [Thermoanaerobaculia bacterium]|jgi:hypothetical protein|nr:hypothetical protein [Thermoanaerobaculia bacterium]